MLLTKFGMTSSYYPGAPWHVRMYKKNRKYLHTHLPVDRPDYWHWVYIAQTSLRGDWYGGLQGFIHALCVKRREIRCLGSVEIGRHVSSCLGYSLFACQRMVPLRWAHLYHLEGRTELWRCHMMGSRHHFPIIAVSVSAIDSQIERFWRNICQSKMAPTAMVIRPSYSWVSCSYLTLVENPLTFVLLVGIVCQLIITGGLLLNAKRNTLSALCSDLGFLGGCEGHWQWPPPSPM